VDVKDGRATACRGVRGAITVDGDGPDAVGAAVAELLDEISSANGLAPEDVAALIFTLPDDLAATNPAAAARRHGWSAVPLLMVREHGGDTRVPRCLRTLLLWNTSKAQSEIRHAYLGGARELRPDLEAEPTR
jgi:chorismate mutase